MTYQNRKLPNYGSFVVSNNGLVQRSGPPLNGEQNEIVAYDPQFQTFNSVRLQDIGELIETEGGSISMIYDQEPVNRPDGKDLEIGDLWFQPSTRRQYLYHGGQINNSFPYANWISTRTGKPLNEQGLYGEFFLGTFSLVIDGGAIIDIRVLRGESGSQTWESIVAVSDDEDEAEEDDSVIGLTGEYTVGGITVTVENGAILGLDALSTQQN